MPEPLHGRVLRFESEKNVKRRHWLLILALGLTACDGTTMMVAEDSAVHARALVQGNVSYEGSADGSLLIGVWPWDELTPSMPMGPPADFVAIDAPAFPVHFEMPEVHPGPYFVGAVLDVGRDSPTVPGTEDAAVYGSQIELLAGDDVSVDLTLPND